MSTIRRLLSTVYALLPVPRSDEAARHVDERTRKALPANFGAVALNGLFFPTAGRILGAGLVLTWFVSDLTDSAFLVGLIIPIQYGLGLVAQPYVGAWLATKPRRATYYLYQALARCALWVGLAAAAWALGPENRTPVLALFFVVISAEAVAAGVGNIAFNDVLARTIPQRMRGSVRSWRGALGGVTAGAAGLLIRAYGSRHAGFGFYALLFAVAGVLYAIGGLLFASVEEPEEAGTPARMPAPSKVVRKIGAMLHEGSFRRFLLVEFLLVPAALGLPLFALFGKRAFALDLDALGLLVAVDAATPIVANLAWGRLADAWGNRWVIAAAAILGVLAAAAALMRNVDRARAAQASSTERAQYRER